MDVSTIVNMVLCILSFLLAAISIIIVIITLKQNSKMIESSTRPYVTVYGILASIDTSVYTIVIKNFGNSSATITNFKSTADLGEIAFSGDRTPFLNIENTTLVPNQSLRADVNADNMPDNITFEIKYKSSNKSYTESSILNFAVEKNLLAGKINFSSNGQPDRMKELSYIGQEFLKKYF